MDKTKVKGIIQRYISELIKNNIIFDRIFLFGSVAKDKATDNSDIDVAIIVDNLKDKLKLQLTLMKIRREIDLRIEPHPISKQDFNIQNPFAKEIIDYGIEINC